MDITGSGAAEPHRRAGDDRLSEGYEPYSGSGSEYDDVYLED